MSEFTLQLKGRIENFYLDGAESTSCFRYVANRSSLQNVENSLQGWQWGGERLDELSEAQSLPGLWEGSEEVKGQWEDFRDQWPVAKGQTPDLLF